MAIVIRIVSADGKKVVMKSLPGLPAKIKIPAGAKVDVTEDGHTMSLAQYVNQHANHGDRDHKNGPEVTVESVSSWDEAEAWLGSLDGAKPVEADPKWFTTGDENDGQVLGFDSTTLIVGGVVAVGAAGGIYALTRNSGGPKDTTAPAAPTTIDLAAADDTGTSDSDNITTKTSGLTITGKAEAGSTVELFDGTTSLGTVTAGSDGGFTKDVDLAAGDHTVTTKATDKAGNTGAASAGLKITVDTTAPGAVTTLDLAADDDTGASNTDNLTTKTTGLTITGKADAGAVVELFDGTTSLGTVTAGTNGTFTKDVDLANGTHAVTAKATDPAGNAGTASEALTITVNTNLIPPAPTGLDLAALDDNGPSNTDNLTSQTSGLTISGVAPASTTVELFDGATSLGSVSVGADGKFSKDITLSGTGSHTITAKTTDSLGNGSAASEALTIVIAAAPGAPTGLDLAADDDTGPSSTDNVTGKATGLTISGTAEAGSTVELFDGTTSLGTVTAGSDGKFTRDFDLANGSHAITAKATNSAGYTGAASSVLDITVDTVAPPTPTALNLSSEVDSGVSNSDNITNRTAGLEITGSAEAGSTIQLYDGVTPLLGTFTASGGSFSILVSLTEGTHAITAKATDSLGNFSTASTALNITIDTTAPGAPAGLDLAAEDDNGASNSDNVTSNTSALTITGTGEAGSTVDLYDNGTRLGAAVVQGDGTFTKDISLALGAHSIIAQATDVAGNVGALATALQITVVAAAQAASAAEEFAAASASSPSDLDHLSLYNSSGSFG